ncbi:hypothetical protein B7494_g4847 [Chlorociboria aeruginascens]|nr:hypothetical protein B7494_g4847 [Chlorociboria aeruginascens]
MLQDIDKRKVKLWLLTNAYVNHGKRVVRLLEIENQFEGLTYCDYEANPIHSNPHVEMFKRAMKEACVEDMKSCYFVGLYCAVSVLIARRYFALVGHYNWILDLVYPPTSDYEPPLVDPLVFLIPRGGGARGSKLHNAFALSLSCRHFNRTPPTPLSPNHAWLAVMLVPTTLWSLTATEVLSLIQRDMFTVEDYANALLDRIESRNSVVKAWQYFDSDLVLSQARALDQVPHDQRGRLHGVAIAIKDSMDTKEYGSPLYKGNRPNADASIVEIVRRAGALIVGKTTTTEFTVLNSGPDTTNPHDPNRTPGGSSAGSAAAVADFQVPLSFGTQTSGSVIRPASYTGTYAMKPTFDTISGGGIKVVSHEFDTIGYFARSIDDLELITDVLSVTVEEAIKEIPLKENKVGFVKSPSWPSAGPGTIAAMENAAEILRNHGVTIVDVEFPDEFNDTTALNRMFEVIFVTDGAVSFYKDYLMDTTKTKLDPDVRAFVEDAPKFSREEIRQALDYFAALRPVFDKIATQYAALITPSAMDEAPLGLGDMGSPVFNSAAHMPVIHVPAFAGLNGMPVGVSLISRRYGDQYLLSIAKILSGPLMSEGNWQQKLVSIKR